MGPVIVVYDTNTLISALGFGGTPLEALLTAFGSGFQIAVSEETLDEFSRVMEYEHLPFSESEQLRYRAILAREAQVVAPEETIEKIERDPDDDKFLECAVTANADYIVSGDQHLLSLGSFRDIKIRNATDFLDDV